ncbi:MAG: DegT/DnrJ/EryC1/StrS aminotransferase family protein [Candidatus Micrarchaeota archaeon]
MATHPTPRKPKTPRHEVPIGFADIGELEKKYVNEALDNKRLSYGPFIQRFEREFAAAHGCKHGIMCNSGTSALRVAVAAAREKFDWKDGDEVLVPAVTFVATSNVLIQQNLKPVFVDVDALTYNIDPKEIGKRITARTRGIMPVHLAGLPCEMDPIMELKEDHELAMIEDSCETMFARYKGKPVGSFGEFGCFSTYVAHILVTGVGGLTLTSDPGLAVLLRSLCNHGRDGIYLSIDDDDAARGKKLDMIMKSRFSFERLGYSFRATELEGALACAQFERKDEILAKRKRNAAFLTSKLSDLKDVLQLPTVPSDREHSFMFYPLVLKDHEYKRDELTLFLEEAGIETRYLLPLINQPIYRKLYGNLDSKYPVAANLNANAFYVGIHQHLGERDLRHVSDVLHEFFERG